jgi:hypothetical protein
MGIKWRLVCEGENKENINHESRTRARIGRRWEDKFRYDKHQRTWDNIIMTGYKVRINGVG